MQESLLVPRHEIHGEQERALLQIDVVTQRPPHARQRGIWPIPGACRLRGRDRAFAGVCSAPPEGLVEPPDRVVSVGDVEHVVGRPSVVKSVGPHTGHAPLGHLLDLMIGQKVPLIDEDRINPRVIRTRARRGVEEGDRFMQVMQHLRMPFEEGPHHVSAEGERQRHHVAIVVVRHVLAPVDQAGRGLIGVRLAVVVEIHLAIASVHLDDGRDEHDQVLSDLLNEGGLLDGQPVGQLHEHLGRAGLRRMNRSCRPIHGEPFGDQPFGLILGDRTRIGESGGDLFVPIQPPHIRFIGDDDQDHLPPLLRITHREDLHSRRRSLQLAHVAVDVLRIRQLVRRTDDIAEHFLRRRDRIGGRQVIHQLGQEERFGRVLANLGRIAVVELLRSWGRRRFPFRLWKDRRGQEP